MADQAVTGTLARPSLIRLAHLGAFWLALALLGMVAFFWDGLVSLFQAWSLPEYSHGYLIPPIALFLFLSRAGDGHAVNERPGRRGIGLAVVFLGLGLGLLGNLAQIPNFGTYGLIVTLAGLVLVGMGLRRGLRLWAPVFYLIFMLPLPSFLYWKVSATLQIISSEIGVGLISLFGVPVHLAGNVIDLGAYQLQVAEACSGLRYLFPLMSFGFLFAILYRGPAWHKIILFISSIPITVAMNAVRIGIIGLLVDRYGIEQAEGFLHFFEGWIIFIACIALLYLLAVALQFLAPIRQPIHRMLEIDFAALAAQARRIGNFSPRPALVAAAVAILAAGLAWQLVPTRAATAPRGEPLILFPAELGDWRGDRLLLDREITRVLGADDYLIADYAVEGGASVNLLIAYYNTQTGGSGIHSPEVCIPGAGWEVSRWAAVDTGLHTASGEALAVNRAIIQKGVDRQLVYYWFEGRGRSVTNDYVAKAYTVLDSVTHGRTDGALVRVITPIAAAEPVELADDRLRGFLTLALPQLPNYIPN